MDLAAVVLFLVMYYLRPQEWTSLFSTIHFVQLVMMMAIVSLFSRERRVRGSDLLKTPHDWMMLAFFAWIVLSSNHPWATFRTIYPLGVFYIVVVQTLLDVHRMKVFIGWWTFLIVGIALLAIASEHGFDPLGGNDITHGAMKDRLILNLSIFDNPNGLGHSVAPSLAMLYFFCIWRRPFVMKQLGLLLMCIPIYCIYLTVSKGAFLCTAGTLLVTATFGRPRTVQIFILSAAILVGGVALYKLPRMSELNRSKADPAIQGRVAAFKTGLHEIRTLSTGVGFGNWADAFFRERHYYKAAHSSYVEIGGELGYPGLFLFLGVLYCNLRTLLTVKARTDDEERIRRTLFVLLISYMVSSWMVDFEYRPTFFMFTAAVAALHRHLAGLLAPPAPETEEEKALAQLPAWRRKLLVPTTPAAVLQPALAFAGPVASYPGPALPAWVTSKSSRVKTELAAEPARPFWPKLGWVDFVLVAAMTSIAVRVWAYMISRM
jgi:O-antigen ligase